MFLFSVSTLLAQTTPYPQAATDRLIHPKTAMLPPPVNTPFTDPDFGSLMVRATDPTTNFKLPGTFLRNEASGQLNEWSADGGKFYVMGKGGQVLVFGFDPATMAISSLPTATPGRALLVPLRAATFSSVDADLIYGTTGAHPLTLSSYRFSTGKVSSIIDTTTCATQPALVSGTGVSSDTISVSGDDSRIAVDEGGSSAGKEMFLVVYDVNLGCRWYNTQTGQVGGQWGAVGTATAAGYLINHAYISKSGNYVRILGSNGWYIWDLATLNVSSCLLGQPVSSQTYCGGYGVAGFNSLVNQPAVLDGMQIVKRPLSDITQITELVEPLTPHNWGLDLHFTWANVDTNDTAPVCASSYIYDGEDTITQPYEGEIFCIETDGVASTIWRFAHNHAPWNPKFFNTQPLGNVSKDGRFFLFTSTWDLQLGTDPNGVTPHSDVWIVKLD